MAVHAVSNQSFDYGERLPAGARSPAGYAASAVPSRGRIAPEPVCPSRSPFQRDRDRILHSTAFRRLTHKTQVFVYHEGDHYRTRLTHSLEVAQIARTVARQLQLDEDLAEALALAHDLGHPPFGHAGERSLNAALGRYGGFDHNAQSLRVVTQLERKYLAFDGLNLTWETLEGLAKHNGPVRSADCAVAAVLRPLEAWQGFELEHWAAGEAQVAALADDIAYLTHDIDDGLRAGLIDLAALADAPIAGDFVRALPGPTTGDESRLAYEVTRRMITVMISDVVTESRLRLRQLAPKAPDDLRHAPMATIAFSVPMLERMTALRAYLFRQVYRHPSVLRVVAGAEAIVADLFIHFFAVPAAMPLEWHHASSGLDDRQRARLIGDFVAGMTDRYAIAEHRRLFDATPELR